MTFWVSRLRVILGTEGIFPGLVVSLVPHTISLAGLERVKAPTLQDLLGGVLDPAKPGKIPYVP